jgi:hypothetical protein
MSAGSKFNLSHPFQFDYLSHCKEVRIRQNGNLLLLLRKKKVH